MNYFRNKKILVTGGKGFLGSHLIEKLIKRGVEKQNIIAISIEDADLRKWENCIKVVELADIVIHLAAKVGGIGFNQNYPGELFYDNAIMGIQLIEAARQKGIEKFVAVGTICAYPK
ncbi:MAG: NAD-dependent epimerase/dehydratase family protein, partial [Candidatus Methanofastidiosa archaeon]|nr:NAD-dependent epimerase/dehydratase family protein [Candidatus Methanofastidiosa archaeon]